MHTAPISWCIVGIPEDVSAASSCILKPDQSCRGGSSSCWGSSRFRRSSWTRDTELRFPEWQPTVSAARPGDRSAGRKTACSISPKHLCATVQSFVYTNATQTFNTAAKKWAEKQVIIFKLQMQNHPAANGRRGGWDEGVVVAAASFVLQHVHVY